MNNIQVYSYHYNRSIIKILKYNALLNSKTINHWIFNNWWVLIFNDKIRYFKYLYEYDEIKLKMISRHE